VSRRRAVVALIAVLGVAGVVVPAASRAATSARRPVVVAVLDSGVNAGHQEFDYRGASSTTDQFVGWWDFTADKKRAVRLPERGQTWDTSVRDPYDDYGHGSLTAAAVGALGRNAHETRSAAPGTRLAIGKIFDRDGNYTSTLAPAIRWAVDSVHADVISLSVGTAVPFPAQLDSPGFHAIQYAHSKGVLVVVSNGNGYGNAGVPGDPGWANAYSSSPDVLAVGGTGKGVYASEPPEAEASFDPEVVADWDWTGPAMSSKTGYTSETGTSFSAPYVAGFAAALISAARATGAALPVGRLETLLKYSATDRPDMPPALEGYGVLSRHELAHAAAHAAAGTLPAPPSDPLTEFWVESVQQSIRTVLPPIG